MDAEVVICAAVIAEGGEVIRCHRHHDGLRALADRQLEHSEHDKAQGFITSRNRYVDRYEAMELQRGRRHPQRSAGGRLPRQAAVLGRPVLMTTRAQIDTVMRIAAELIECGERGAAPCPRAPACLRQQRREAGHTAHRHPARVDPNRSPR
jgi:hypothetical protein